MPPRPLHRPPSVSDDMTISSECLEELREIRSAATAAAKGAHAVACELKRLGDFADHVSVSAKKWFPRVVWLVAGAVVAQGGAGPLTKALLAWTGHPT